MTVTVRNGDVNGALRVLKEETYQGRCIQELRERTSMKVEVTKRRKANLQLVGTNVRCRTI